MRAFGRFLAAQDKNKKRTGVEMGHPRSDDSYQAFFGNRCLFRFPSLHNPTSSVKNENELVERKMFLDSMGVNIANLKDEFLTSSLHNSKV